MHNRQNNIFNKNKIDLLQFFDAPISERQRQYEAVRPFIKERLSTQTVAEKFAYKATTIYSLVRDAQAGKLNLLPEVKKARLSARHPNLYKRKSSGIIDSICDSIDEGFGKDPVAFQMDESENVFIDGKQISLDAKERIVLRYGK